MDDLILGIGAIILAYVFTLFFCGYVTGLLTRLTGRNYATMLRPLWTPISILAACLTAYWVS